MTPDLRAIPEGLERLERRSLLLGGAAGLVAVAVGFARPDVFFRSYLVAYVFWLGISLGCLAILLLQHLSGGSWAVVIRRLLESGARTLSLMALLFLPLVAGLHRLYEWTHAEVVQADPVLLEKQLYLNVPFFLVRAALYFAIWAGLALLLGRWSVEQDRGQRADSSKKMRSLSGAGIAVLVLTVTFASVDWMMSLEPHWFSTIYGALFLAGSALGALAFTIAVALLLARREPLQSAVSPAHLHDLGKLLFAFVMVWAYFAFSQFLIIWAGNLPEEIPWYLRRMQGGWQALGLTVALGQFVLPFLLLLSRGTKRNPKTLIRVAILVVFLRLVDATWMIVPAFEDAGLEVLALVLVVALALGGLWIWAFLRTLRQHPLLPVGDPHLEEALAHGRH